MRLSGQRGGGLILMIMLIAISAVMIGGVTVSMTNAAALSALRINQVRAYYLAQGAVMRSYADFDVSWGREDVEVSALALAQTPPVLAANYAPLPASASTVTEIVNTNFQSNFAYFMTSHPRFIAEWWPLANPSTPANPVFPQPPNLWCRSNESSARSRLHGWTVKNIRTALPGGDTGDNLIATGVRVFWTGGDDALGVATIRLSNSTTNFTTGGIRVFNGNGVKGALLPLRGVPTLQPGESWTGPCTYIQWTGRMPDPARVSIQFIFRDDVPARTPACPNNLACSSSHEVVLWDGLINGEGRMHTRTFSITGVGEVRMNKFGSRKKLRATFEHAPSADDRQARNLGWENLDP